MVNRYANNDRRFDKNMSNQARYIHMPRELLVRVMFARKRRIGDEIILIKYPSILKSPGVNLVPEEKLEIARNLSALGVDIIEAGFPIASLADFEAVARIAKEIGPLMDSREKIGKPMVIKVYKFTSM